MGYDFGGILIGFCLYGFQLCNLLLEFVQLLLGIRNLILKLLCLAGNLVFSRNDFLKVGDCFLAALDLFSLCLTPVSNPIRADQRPENIKWRGDLRYLIGNKAD